MAHFRHQAGPTRRSLVYLVAGVAGAVVILAASAWACTTVPNTTTSVSPNSSTNVSGNVGLNVNSWTNTTAGNGLPNNNYWFRHRPLGVGTACEMTAAIGAAVASSGGVIASPGSPVTRPLTWNIAYDNSGAGQVCWASNQSMNEDHASQPATFTIN